MSFKEVVEIVGLVIDGLGVAVIALGLAIASVRFLVHGRKSSDGLKSFRHDVGRGILLGLEFLVAADIIRSVVVAPTLQKVAVLGVIVLIRTFLSISIEVELKGRWPWQASGNKETS